METHADDYVELREDSIGSSSADQKALRGGSNSVGDCMREAVAEMIGTFLIAFTGSAGGIFLTSSEYGQMSTAIVGGVAVVLMIFATGHISKAHFNPAVTLGFAMAGVFPWKQVIPYVLSQLIGSSLASASLQVIVHDATLFSAAINQPLEYRSASFVMECVATFFLMFINMKVACNLGQVGSLGGAFMVGTTVALLGIYAGPLCGGLSMNPARSIGPALVALNFKSLYIFVIGPIIGAILSGVTYGIICPRDNDTRLLTRQSFFNNPFTCSKSSLKLPS